MRYYTTIMGQDEHTEAEYLALVGDDTQRPYVLRLYQEEITLADVPEDLQEAVQTIVNNRIARWGLWKDLPASAHEVTALTEAVATANLTKGQARAFFAALRTLRDGATDAQASTAVDLYPTMKYDMEIIRVGTRINFNGTLYRAAVDLYDSESQNPDNAPNLWERIEYHNGVRIIPETITAGTAFGYKELGYWEKDGCVYRSEMADNVWTPEQYPTAWTLWPNWPEDM